MTAMGGVGPGLSRRVRAWRLVGRDGVALRWIGEQYCVPRDLLEVLLARLSEFETVRDSGRVGATVVGRAVARWKALGLAETRAFIVGEGASVWPTAEGMRLGGLEFRAGPPSVASVGHRHAVARVRAFMEGERPDWEWTSERELRSQLQGNWQGRGRLHVADAVVLDEAGGRVAVEVELVPKSPERVAQIVAGHLGEYDRVVYFAARRARAVIERAAAKAGWGPRLDVRPYPPGGAVGPSGGVGEPETRKTTSR